MPIVFLFQLWQLTDALLGLFLLVADIAFHALVGDDGTGLNRSRKHHSIEVSASAEGDIYLPWGEREVGIDDGAVEGEALALVNGDSPGQSQGQLAELALHLGLYLSRLRVQLILRILPFQRFYLYCLAIVRTKHKDTTVADFDDFTDTAVEVAMLSRGVVFHEHHLCALFQRQLFTRRIGILREVALDLCLEGITATRQFGEFVLVVTVCQMVVGGQTDVAFAGLGDEGGLIPII